MQILTCLLFALIFGGILGSLQMDKDLQYNCYYQILRKYSAKSNHSDADYADYSHRLDDSPELSLEQAESTESLLRMRREIIASAAESSGSSDHPANDFGKTFSSAYAEPRNSGRYRQSSIALSQSSTAKKAIKMVYLTEDIHSKDASYLIVASKILRSGFVYKVSVSVLQAQHPIKVYANISCDSVNLSNDTKDIPEGATETLLLHVPSNALRKRNCRLRMEGFFLNVFCDLAFLHEDALEYVRHSHMILIQTDKPLYQQDDVVRFRVTVTNFDFKPSDCIVEVRITDPNGYIVWRWLTQLPATGTIGLEYNLAEEPSFGEWTITVVLPEQEDQEERSNFTVEEYYRPRFEVEVKVPAVFLSSSAFVRGSVKVTSTTDVGEAVSGKLSLTATIFPLGYLDAKAVNKHFRLGFFAENINTSSEALLASYKPSKELLNRVVYTAEEFNYLSGVFLNGKSLSQKVVEKFNGSHIFKWPRDELENSQGNLTAFEILITASMVVDFEDEAYAGYAITRIYKPSKRVVFLGGSPQVFKPSLPFSVFLAVEHVNSSPLDVSLLGQESHMEVSGVIRTEKATKEFNWPKRRLHMLRHRLGIWELKVDLRSEFPRDVLVNIVEMRLIAKFTAQAEAATGPTKVSAEMLLIASYSPRHHYIKVTTSTDFPTVGEYIIFEINTNFFVEHFHYMVLSRGVIVLNERESLTDGMRTMALVISAEMAPLGEIVVWAVTWQGEIVTDSLSFPVTGMFVNNFTLNVRTSHEFTYLGSQLQEVSVLGEPGSHVSLVGVTQEALDNAPDAFKLTYSGVISKLSYHQSKIRKHMWRSYQEGSFSEFNTAFYPTPTVGIDADATFLESGLIVLTDGFVARRLDACNKSAELDQCLDGSCFPSTKRCDGVSDCIDGSDESGCQQVTQYDLRDFNRFRVNRISRHYKNAIWLWRDVKVGNDGKFKFYTSVPSSNGPSQWILSGYSTSVAKGIGLGSEALAAGPQQPFIVDLTLPRHCRSAMVATITLRKSASYESEKSPVSIKLASHERKSVNVIFKTTASGRIKVVLHVESVRYGSIDIARELIVGSNEVRYTHEQRLYHHRLRHHVVLLNLTHQQKYFIKYLNKTNSDPISCASISGVGSAFAVFTAATPSSGLETAQDFVFAFAASLYSLMYLRLVRQQPNVTAEREIFYSMNRNYQRLVSYMRPDGSFALLRSDDWNPADSSVWLTAYCLRLLQEAAAYKMVEYIWIDNTIIEKSLHWILQQQMPTGGWFPRAVSMEPSDNNMTLTAHVLITLAAMTDLNDSLTRSVRKAKINALSWLESNLQPSNDTYEVAITTYALLLSNSSLAEQTLSRLRSLAHRNMDTTYVYWSSSEREESFLPGRINSISVEITAYALLSYLLHRERDVSLVVTWLNSNRFADEGRGMSTRASVAATHALLQFAVHTRLPESTAITVELAPITLQITKNYTFHINSSNAALMQRFQLCDAWNTLKIRAKGVGYAILQVAHEDVDGVDNATRQQPMPPAFRIENEAICRGKYCSHITVTCCINWLDVQQKERSGLSILDVAIPTGYKIQQQHLNAQVLSGSVKNLMKAKFMETKIVFFFANLDQEGVCLNFTIKRWYAVANLTRFLPVRAYEYSAPENFVETVYDALPSRAVLKICRICGSSNCINCHFGNDARQKSDFKILLLLLIFYDLLKL